MTIRRIVALCAILITSTIAAQADTSPRRVKDIATLKSLSLATMQTAQSFQVDGRNGGTYTWLTAAEATGLAPDGTNNIIGPSEYPLSCSHGCLAKQGDQVLTYNIATAGASDDGVTDASPAVQAVFDAVAARYGNAVIVVPPAAVGYRLASAVTLPVQSHITIQGYGPSSVFLVDNSTGGIKAEGSCGTRYENFYVKDIRFVPLRTSGFGFSLWGIAAYGANNIDIGTTGGTPKFTHAIELLGAQQGYVHGGLSIQHDIGIYLNDCTAPGGGVVSSNGNDIGAGRSFGGGTAAIDIEGGASDVWIHNTHITSSVYSVINNQTNGAGGYGTNYYTQSHQELNTSGIKVQSGKLFVSELNDFTSPTDTSFTVASGAMLTVNNSLINGLGSVASGGFITATHNTINQTITISALCANVNWQNNVGNGAPSACPNNNNNIIAASTPTPGFQLQFNTDNGNNAYFGTVSKTDEGITTKNASGTTTSTTKTNGVHDTPSGYSVGGYQFAKPAASGGTVDIVGTNTNNSAAAGSVGEYVESSIAYTSAVSLTTGVVADITNISLSAGDWNVWGNICFTGDATAVTTQQLGWINTTSATTTPDNDGSKFKYNYGAGMSFGTATSCYPVGVRRLLLGSSGTAYLSARSNFTVTTTAYGQISARRVR